MSQTSRAWAPVMQQPQPFRRRRQWKDQEEQGCLCQRQRAILHRAGGWRRRGHAPSAVRPLDINAIRTSVNPCYIDNHVPCLPTLTPCNLPLACALQPLLNSWREERRTQRENHHAVQHLPIWLGGQKKWQFSGTLLCLLRHTRHAHTAPHCHYTHTHTTPHPLTPSHLTPISGKGTARRTTSRIPLFMSGRTTRYGARA